MTEQKQIDEMAIEMSGCGKSECAPCRLYRLGLCAAYKDASRAISAGYRKQIAGEWHWIADDSPMCNICGTVYDTDDYADAWLWNFCPNCGARMKGVEGK